MSVRWTMMDPTPIGPLTLTADEDALVGISFGIDEATTRSTVRDDDCPVLKEARRQLEEYFAGVRTEFDLPLAPRGTPFQLRVWEQLRLIPYGSTTSYGELASRLGDRNASRAVGLANGRNPIPIVVPCHRVIGADGSLTGFSGGVDTKRRLLELEAATLF